MSNKNEVFHLEKPTDTQARLLNQAVHIIKLMLVKYEMDHTYLQLDNSKIYYATAFDTPVINRARGFLDLMEDVPDPKEYGYERVGHLNREAAYSGAPIRGGEL